MKQQNHIRTRATVARYLESNMHVNVTCSRRCIVDTLILMSKHLNRLNRGPGTSGPLRIFRGGMFLENKNVETFRSTKSYFSRG